MSVHPLFREYPALQSRCCHAGGAESATIRSCMPLTVSLSWAKSSVKACIVCCEFLAWSSLLEEAPPVDAISGSGASAELERSTSPLRTFFWISANSFLHLVRLHMLKPLCL